MAFALPVSGPWQERASELCRVIRNELLASEGDLHRAVLFDRSGRPAEVIRLLALAQELDRDATFELGLKLLIDGLARRAGGPSPPSH